ncbi:MAG: CRISPR-associated protein Cas5 [Deltaproteobacteria bacterium]|nr:CRISPR-associated protein Cas5 [Deltaproteobacteria bacterium]
MEALKIKLYQNMANYRKELSYGYVQTYPLPTPSMVKGMAHYLLGLDKFENLKISIQGNFKSISTNMQKIIKFDRDPKSRPDNLYKVTIGSSLKTALHAVMFVDQIVDIELLLHIAFQNQDLNCKLLNAVKEKTVILGRNEDIAFVDFKTFGNPLQIALLL